MNDLPTHVNNFLTFVGVSLGLTIRQSAIRPLTAAAMAINK